jgi:hypothetical protein
MADDRKPPPRSRPPGSPTQGNESNAGERDGRKRGGRRLRPESSGPSALADAHLPLLEDGDLILRALRTLPALPLPAPKDARIQTRATAQFLETSARHRRISEQTTSKTALALARATRRLARPILPLSVAGFALGYLIWAVHTAATFLP